MLSTCWRVSCIAAQLTLLMRGEQFGLRRGWRGCGVAVQLCGGAAVLLICYVLLCCGAAGVAGAAVLVCRGAAGVADAMVLLVAVVSTCWRVSRCCWLLLALQKRCCTVVRQLLLARR